MPTFFFDTKIDGECSRDDEGVSLPALSDAKREAVLALYYLAAEIEPKGEAMHAALFVRDGEGAVVLRLDMDLTVSQSPSEEAC